MHKNSYWDNLPAPLLSPQTGGVPGKGLRALKKMSYRSRHTHGQNNVALEEKVKSRAKQRSVRLKKQRRKERKTLSHSV